MIGADDSVKHVARALHEIAHSLDSAEGAEARVRRALRLFHELVPYERCALLEALPGGVPELLVVPDAPDAERGAIAEQMARALELVCKDDVRPVAATVAPHLTLPLMGLDQVVGIIRVYPPAGVEYQAEDLRLLSVVAAQIGAYLALLSAHQMQRNLVGIVSHDLRTPLTVISSMVSAVMLRATDERQVKNLTRALRNAERASHILNDLLDTTQARFAGVISTTPRECDLCAAVREVVDDARAAHPDRVILYEDASGRSLIAWWDPDRLAQLAANLVGNAIAHGDGTRPVTVTLTVADDAATLTTHNHGPSIPDGAMSTLFDPFTRAADRFRGGGGVGLGLYIVDQIARAHGGHVTVTSDDEHGTTFAVTLPIRQHPPEPQA